MDGITPIALWIYAQENHHSGPGPCNDRAVLRRGWLAGVLVFVWPAVTLAGPPLIADDPNTLGSGQLQVSPAFAASGGYGEVSVSGPILDSSLGLLPGVDFSLFGTPLFVLAPGAPGGRGQRLPLPLRRLRRVPLAHGGDGARGAGRGDDVFIGANAGVDWTSPKRVHLLASGGVALESRGRTAPVWRAFVGLSWEFTLWSADFGV